MLSALNRHLYYLTEELVVLCLFSNKVDENTKEAMASKIVSFAKPKTFALEKPKVPIMDIGTTLPSLVGPNSWLLFDVMGDTGDWLLKSSDMWENDHHYVETRAFVRSMKVVNDSSERGVKLIQDFCNVITVDSEKRRHLLKSVQSSRTKFPNFKKETLNQ